MVTRKELLEYADENYNTQSEHLWAKYPSYEVLRHNSNRKWYAVIMDIPRNKVGLDGTVADEEIYNLLDMSYELTK